MMGKVTVSKFLGQFITSVNRLFAGLGGSADFSSVIFDLTSFLLNEQIREAVLNRKVAVE